MFDVTHLALCFAAVFCFASLIKGGPVETASRWKTCDACGQACNCGAAAATRCTCHERLQSQGFMATGHGVRVARSVPTSQSAHHVLKRVRRCRGSDTMLGASRSIYYSDQPPAPANRKLREEIQRRLQEIRTRLDAIKSLGFLGYRRASVIGNPLPTDSPVNVESLAATADETSIADVENSLESAGKSLPTDSPANVESLVATADETSIADVENSLKSAVDDILADQD